MSVAEPDACLPRVFLQDADVDLDGARVLADPGQHRSLEGPVVGIARFGLEQSLDLRQRRGMITLAVQSHGVVLTGAVEVRREFQTPRQQVLGVVVAADAGGDLGEHAQRGDVGGMLVQVPPQQCFGFGNAVLAQRRAGGEEARVACGCLEEARARRLGASIIADRPQVIGERAPGIRQIRVEFDGTLEFGDGLVATTERPECHAMLVARGGPARLTKHQRCEQCLRRGGIAAEALRDRQDQKCIGVSGRRLEDLVCLFGGERRVAIEQPRGVRERDVDGSDRFCCATTAHVTNLPRSLRLLSRPGGNCAQTTAVEQCVRVIQIHDAFVGISQQLARPIRGGARRSLLLAVSAALLCQCGAPAGRRAPGSHSRGAVCAAAPVSAPRSGRHLLLLSGDGGWGPGLDAIAQRLGLGGTAVAGIHAREWLEALEHAGVHLRLPRRLSGAARALAAGAVRAPRAAGARRALRRGDLAYVALAQGCVQDFRGAVTRFLLPGSRSGEAPVRDAALRRRAPGACARCPYPGLACMAWMIATVPPPRGAHSWKPCPVRASCRCPGRVIPTATSTAGGHRSAPPTRHSPPRPAGDPGP